MHINQIYISPETAHLLPPNIKVIESDNREEAFAAMHQAVTEEAPVNAAIWYRPQTAMESLFREALALSSKKEFHRAVTLENFHKTLRLKFGKSAGEASFFDTDELNDEITQSFNTARRLWSKRKIKMVVATKPKYKRENPGTHIHIDNFSKPAVRMVQPMLKPETIVFANDDFDVYQKDQDGVNKWQVRVEPPNSTRTVNGFLIPQGSIGAFATCMSPHVAAIHAHGLTRPGEAVPRMIVKLDVSYG